MVRPFPYKQVEVAHRLTALDNTAPTPGAVYYDLTFAKCKVRFVAVSAIIWLVFGSFARGKLVI